jgi:hypothetical protein
LNLLSSRRCLAISQIPKHSIQGFDGGDNLITTLKKETNDQFSAENPVADL